MELIQIDSVNFTYAEAYLYGRAGSQLLLDTDTGVVYFSGSMQPRYDANGRVMVIPRDQLPGVIARARAQCSHAQALAAAKKAEEKRKHSFTQV